MSPPFYVSSTSYDIKKKITGYHQRFLKAFNEKYLEQIKSQRRPNLEQKDSRPGAEADQVRKQNTVEQHRKKGHRSSILWQYFCHTQNFHNYIFFFLWNTAD